MKDVPYNMRCIGGRWDGQTGVWGPALEGGEEAFPEDLWIALCTIPDCECGGSSLAAAECPQDLPDETRYVLHGCEEHVERDWLVGIYREESIEDLPISRHEVALETAGVA